MRRIKALTLFTLGYAVMASFDPNIAAVPSLAVFAVGAHSLVRPFLRPAENAPTS